MAGGLGEKTRKDEKGFRDREGKVGF